MASIFTTSGAAARKFRYEVPAGNIGVNIGVAAPMAYFPFSGWRDSFFGTVHGQGRDAIEFYTHKKDVIERWPKEWSRRLLIPADGANAAWRTMTSQITRHLLGLAAVSGRYLLWPSVR